MSTDQQANRLIHEKSPYLLQHAYNPVNWYPWTEEAFEKARREDKPVFVSIGYSTCHWCHVMERESFEDEVVAQMLNDKFIAIKVDREERPDIDHIYMTVCQALTGSGGWPMSVFLTPDKLPFYAGTYYPKESRFGSIGFIQLLENISKVWVEKREKLIESGEQIRTSIKRYNEREMKEEDIKEEIFHKAYRRFEQSFDPTYGGFTKSPKFPMPTTLMFLMYYYHFYSEDKAKAMVGKTLDSMYKGGIYDHLGGGFARYATDQKWLVPHFEKMLYDNALLAYTYTLYYTLSQEKTYKLIAKNTLDYCMREMQDGGGGFYSAEDADSEGEEGLFYIWEYYEVIEILGDEDGTFFNETFNITRAGNFEGKNILNLLDSKQCDSLLEDERIQELKRKLYRARAKRSHPYKDDKVLTSWNGLMIAAMAHAGRVFKEEKYVEAAKRGCDFILRHLTNEKGEVFVRYREGQVKEDAFLDDYAFIIWGLLEVYEATLDNIYLRYANKFLKTMKERFYDQGMSCFYMTPKGSEELGMRPKELYDGAVPSGNSVALYVMLKLARMTGADSLEKEVYQFFRKNSEALLEAPEHSTFALLSLMLILNPVKDIVIVLPQEDSHIEPYLQQLSHTFTPYVSLMILRPSDHLEDINGSLRDKKTKDEKITFYLCQRGQCFEPFTDFRKAYETLER